MSSADVEKIKDRLSIVDIVGQYTQLKKAGRNYTARCPFHKEKTPSFHVSPERGTYMCFGCGERGDIFSFVQKIEGGDFPTVLRQLAEKAGVVLERGPNIRLPEDVEKLNTLIEICTTASEFYRIELKKRADVQDYLNSRGLKDSTVDSWKIGYAPAKWEALSDYLLSLNYRIEDLVDSGLCVNSEKRPGKLFDRFRGRIMFPISDSGGKIIAFSGRFFEKVPGQRDDIDPAKYINSPETPIFKKSKTLYGYDRAIQSIIKARAVLLVEGQFDLVLSHQSGMPYAVALSGTALTEDHLSRLKRLTRNLVLALDADQAGVRSGLKSALMALNAGFEVKVPVFAEGKDPADVARENPELLKAAVRTSKTAVEFFLDALRPQAKDERSYQRLVEAQILPLIAAMQSKIEQAHFARIVAERLHVPESAVLAEVGKRPVLQEQAPEEEAPTATFEDTQLAPLERKAGMLIFYFAKESPMYAKLVEVMGEGEVTSLETRLAPQAETLRFRFDAELGSHTTEEKVAEDMLRQISDALHKERFRMKFL